MSGKLVCSFQASHPCVDVARERSSEEVGGARASAKDSDCRDVGRLK